MIHGVAPRKQNRGKMIGQTQSRKEKTEKTLVESDPTERNSPGTNSNLLLMRILQAIFNVTRIIELYYLYFSNTCFRVTRTFN